MNLYNLGGHVAVVTGADSGIGYCFSKELARRGCDVVMVSNRNENLMVAAAEIRDKYKIATYPIPIDLCSADACGILLAALDSRGLDPDIFINNAGIFSFNTVADTHPDKISTFIDLHVRAVTMLSRAFAIKFAERKRGWILNMSSMSCWMPMPGLALYSATKAYIRVFTRALHYEMLDSGVGVTVACPGGIATDLFGLPANLMRLALRLHAVQTPEKFAKVALNKMLKRRKQYINGWINRLSIFFVAITTTSQRMLIKHHMLDKNIVR